MKNIFLISRFTFRESLSKKTFLTFFGLSSIILLILIGLIAAFGVDDLVNSFQGKQRINGELVDVKDFIVYRVKDFFIAPLYGVGLFFSIFSVSGLIPSMLEKGNIDVFLSKPISRGQLILGKFFGGIFIVFVNIAYFVGGIWLLLGLKFGIWESAFLLTIGTITIAFAVLYSLVILGGILTRSSVLAMMLSILIFLAISPALRYREQIYELINGTWQFILDTLYYIFPKTSELFTITIDLSNGNGIFSWQPIITSLLFMILTLALSITIFSKKDY